MKRWKYLSERAQQENTFKVVYFDAFEHDYLDDPFVAFVHEISAQIKGKNTEKVRKLMKLALKAVFKNMAGQMTAGISNDVIDKIFMAELSRKDEIKRFKEGLENVAKEVGNIVIIIDELDRCKPDFALNMLEHIKHLFHVKNVHFILGYNGPALEEIIKTRYGAKINAQRYLDKFITVKMNHMPIENPHAHSTVTYFQQKFNEMEIEKRNFSIKYYARAIGMALIERHRPSLRDINLLLTDLALMPVLDTRFSNYEFKRIFRIILKIMRWIDRDLYNRIKQDKHYRDDLIEANKIRDSIAQWLNDYSLNFSSASDSEIVNERIKEAVQFFLDYEGLKGTHPNSKQAYNHTKTGVYIDLENEIFSEIERVDSVTPVAEATATQ